jgi:hypothetical protein
MWLLVQEFKSNISDVLNFFTTNNDYKKSTHNWILKQANVIYLEEMQILTKLDTLKASGLWNLLENLLQADLALVQRRKAACNSKAARALEMRNRDKELDKQEKRLIKEKRTNEDLVDLEELLSPWYWIMLLISRLQQI